MGIIVKHHVPGGQINRILTRQGGWEARQLAIEENARRGGAGAQSLKGGNEQREERAAFELKAAIGGVIGGAIGL